MVSFFYTDNYLLKMSELKLAEKLMVILGFMGKKHPI